MKLSLMSFLVILLFFTITYLIFPWDLYSINVDKFRNATSANAIKEIPFSEITSTAARGMVPWVILSPWSIISQFKCKEIACAFWGISGVPAVIILFLAYWGFAVSFLRRRVSGDVRMMSRFKLTLVFIWVVFALTGAYQVKRNFIDPRLAINGIIKMLQNASGKEAFPPGTTNFSIANPHFPKPDWYTQDIDLAGGGGYSNPTNSKEQYIFLLYTLNKPLVQTVEKKCEPNDAFDIAEVYNDFWACRARTERYNNIFYGFLDRDRKILIQINGLPEEKNIPTFVKYYKGQ